MAQRPRTRNRLRWFLVFPAAGLVIWAALSGWPAPRQDRAPVFAAAPQNLTLIAHAGGGLESGAYSNALEAMDLAYANGLRFFELDFTPTSDGELVALHDWEHSFDDWFDVSAFDRLRHAIGAMFGWPRRPLSHEAFMARSMRLGLTQMDLGAAMAWMSQHEDAYLVTDLKGDNIAGLAKIARVSTAMMDRVIPQIYRIEEYQPVRDLGFAKVILTTYRIKGPVADVIDRAAALDIFALTIPLDRTRQVPAGRLNSLPFPVFTHTINAPDVAAKAREAGVSGVYTDYLVPVAE